MSTQTFTGTLVVQDCVNCGITFGVTRAFDSARLADRKSFCCPAGHWQSYIGKTPEQEARDELEAERRRVIRLNALLDQERAEREAAERSRRAVQGHLTRARKRAANGVCPCCSRTFADVQRHLAAKHPEHVERVNGG